MSSGEQLASSPLQVCLEARGEREWEGERDRDESNAEISLEIRRLARGE